MKEKTKNDMSFLAICGISLLPMIILISLVDYVSGLLFLAGLAYGASIVIFLSALEKLFVISNLGLTSVVDELIELAKNTEYKKYKGVVIDGQTKLGGLHKERKR